MATGTEANTLKLGPELTAAHVTDVHATLLAQLNAGKTVSCDLSEVERCDTAAIQLLLSAANSFNGAGLAFQIGPCSEAVKTALHAVAVNDQTAPLLFAGKEA